MFHPSSASIKHKLDVNAMLSSIRQTRGRPPFRSSSKQGTPCGELFSFAPASIEPGEVKEEPRGGGRSISARSTRSSRADSLHPFPFRSPSASAGIPDRLFQRSSSSRRSASRKTDEVDYDRKASSSIPPDDLHLLQRQDLSRRCGSSSLQRHGNEEYERNVQRVVAARLGSVSKEPMPLEKPRSVVMRKVKHDLLRAEGYDRGRKSTVDDLRKPHVLSVSKLFELIPNMKRFDNPLALCDVICPFCPTDVLHKLALLSMEAHKSFSQLAHDAEGSTVQDKDSKVALERRCRVLSRKVLAIPEAFVEALKTYQRVPPSNVLAMARIVTPIVENDPQLCLLPDAVIAWKLLQGHLCTTFAENSFLMYIESLLPSDKDAHDKPHVSPVVARQVLKAVATKKQQLQWPFNDGANTSSKDPCELIAEYIIAVCKVCGE